MVGVREALRNIARRKVRSGLTIFGVAIGIFAFTTMASMAAYFNDTLNSILDYYTTRVIVTSEAAGSAGNGGFFAQGGNLPPAVADRIKVLEGVKTAYPTITFAVEDEVATFGAPPVIYGVSPAASQDDPTKLKIQSGRELQEGDSGKVVVGSSIVLNKKLKVGDKVKLRGDREFEVVGTLARTNGGPDSFYIVNLPDAQAFVKETAVFSAEASNYVTDINVIPKEGVSADDLAGQINDKIRGVSAISPSKFKQQIEQGFAVFNLIILGSALIALIVGSLSVINTMIMTVSERRKEIGVKRVVGAKARHILSEIMTETAVIGLIGGVIGVAMAAILTTIINNVAADSGLIVFSLTLPLAAASILGASVLGFLAGMYPAWRATRIRPVNVLREE